MRWSAFLVLAACSEETTGSITVIDAPRVLAIPSEPSVLDVDGEIRLTTLTVDAAGPRTGDAVRLRACSPWRFVAEPAIDCIGPDALSLAAAADGSFTVSTAQLLAAFPPPSGSADAEALTIAIAAGLDPRIPVIAEVDVDGETLVARRDLHIVVDATELSNPRLADVRFDGIDTRTLAAGQRYELTLGFDLESFDPRNPDDEEEPERLERFDCYFYSPHGALEEHEIDVREPELSIETPPNGFTAGAAGGSWLFLVVTDRTGGMMAEAVPLVIE